MREIKFRGKVIDSVDWVYGDLLQYRVLPVIFDKELVQHEVDAETVGQYTGLKDKHGREIYEWDIVRWQSTHSGASQDEHVDTVAWDNIYACYMLIPWIHEPHAASMTVIGNVHDNPELIGE